MPSAGEPDPLTGLIREVRICFNRLKSLAEALHGDLGINPSMRGVLETLNGHGPLSVPAVARMKGVSRQHVQKVMNSLVEARYVTSQDNPGHRRSPLYRLTGQGAALFAQITLREAAPLGDIAGQLSVQEMESAAATLSRLNRVLEDDSRADNQA